MRWRMRRTKRTPRMVRTKKRSFMRTVRMGKMWRGGGVRTTTKI